MSVLRLPPGQTAKLTGMSVSKPFNNIHRQAEREETPSLFASAMNQDGDYNGNGKDVVALKAGDKTLFETGQPMKGTHHGGSVNRHDQTWWRRPSACDGQGWQWENRTSGKQ